jgi:putative acyl-CoA dehydrogenase
MPESASDRKPGQEPRDRWAPPRRPPGEVFNQPPPLADYNLFSANRPLVEALHREGAGWAQERALAMGALAGGEALAWGFQANENPPELRVHDRYGHRVDEIRFHPAWHRLMGTAIAHELHALPWRADAGRGAHVARAALFYLLTQAEAGHGCPISMTHAAVPVLRTQPELAARWVPLLTSTDYDPRALAADEKHGALCGMAMTEKQGGSDVRANTSVARAIGARGPGSEYELTGHKWFCSAPMSDLFLMLAYSEGGLSCFALPRFLPDGERNRFYVQQLKDKLGNRSNASGEVDFDRAWARMVGDEGRGVATIIEMVNHTRLDCVIGSAAGMREAVAQATHHATHRSAFGRTLAEQPLMANVLTDLCLESEAATALAMRLARAYDLAGGDPAEEAFRRVATAVGKYWVCKRTAPHIAEALECLGGNGYVESSTMPRLYREAPVNSAWEGPGNVICLDVLRALGRQPQTREAFIAECDRGAGRDANLDRRLHELHGALTKLDESNARQTVELMALTLQGALLTDAGDAAVAEAFCAARLADRRSLAFGTLPAGLDCAAIIERNTPQLQ